MNFKRFIKIAGCGAAMGIAMIIPGVSGGTLAVLLHVYDDMINSVSNLFKDFKNSFAFLFPLFLGALVAIFAAYFPIKYALRYAPLPTVLLFVGLMLGSFPQLIKDAKGRGFVKLDILSIVIPCLLVIAVAVLYYFNTSAGGVDLSEAMGAGGYILLFIMGVASSCALVIPGISGSMILIVFGYYYPIIDAVSAITVSFGHYALVLCVFAVGVVIGFFTIAKIMKFLLAKFPRGTYWAIIGFVIGSIPAIFISFDYATNPHSAIHVFIGLVLCALGMLGSYALNELFAKKQINPAEEKSAADAADDESK